MKNRILCALFAVALVVVMLAATVGAASFVDVKANAWYAADVDYVAEKGIMNGTNTDKTTFSPAATISRSEVMLMIYNYEVANYGAVENDGAYTFTDIGKHWIKNQAVALKWAQDAGIVVDEDTTDDVVALRPDDAITRIEMAEMLYNYLATHKEIGNYINCAEINENLTVISEYADLYDYPDMSDNQFNAMVLMGQMALVAGTPNPDNPDMPFFDPYAKSDRAQAAALFARLDRTTSHVSFDAKVAIGQFNKVYKDPIHGDCVYFAIKSADTYNYDAVFAAIEKAVEYDADVYDLVVTNYNLAGDWSKVGAFSLDGDFFDFALVAKEDPSVKVETHIYVSNAKYSAESALDYRYTVCLPAFMCVSDTMAANQALIQADAEVKLNEFLANITDEVDEEGRPVVYLFVSDGGNFNAWNFNDGDTANVEWFANAAMDLYLNPGYAPLECSLEVTPETAAAVQADLVNDGDTASFTSTFWLANVMVAGWDRSDNTRFDYAASKEIKFVVTKDSTAIGKKLLWGKSPNLRGAYGAEDIEADYQVQLDRITCDECGLIHEMVKDPRIDKVLDAFMGTLSRKYTFVEYNASVDPAALPDDSHVTVNYSFKLRELGTTGEPTEVKFAIDMYKHSEYAKNNCMIVAGCRADYAMEAAKKMDSFIADYTCPECGVIHYSLKDNGYQPVRLHDALSAKLDAKGFYDVMIYTDPSDMLLDTNLSNANASLKYIFPTADERNKTTVKDLKNLLVKGSGYVGNKDTQAFNQKLMLVYWHKDCPDNKIVRFVTIEARCISQDYTGFGKYVIENKYETVTNHVTGESKVFCQYDKFLGDAEYLAWVEACKVAHAAMPESQAQIAKFQASLDAYVAKFGTAITGTIDPAWMQSWAGGAGLAWPVFIEAMRAQEGDLKLVDEGDDWYARLYTDFSNILVDGSVWNGDISALGSMTTLTGNLIYKIETSAYGSVFEVTVPVNLTISAEALYVQSEKDVNEDGVVDALDQDRVAFVPTYPAA